MAQCFHSASLSLPPRIPYSPLYSSQLNSSIPRRVDLTKQAFVVRPGIETTAGTGTGTGTRVFVVSDLHTDYSENMCWVNSLSCHDHDKDVLVVAGDVAETCANFVLTMSLLKDKFKHVFFVPGNHDLWLRREKNDYLGSLDKLDKLLDACEKLGVETKPGIIDGLGLIPLYSWYHESFDKEKDITGIRIPSLEMVIHFLSPSKDFTYLFYWTALLTGIWPDELKKEQSSLALHFDSLNDKNWDIVEDILRRCSHIISFSHFVPRQELCPEKRMLYVQAPLAYPRERKRRMNGGEEWLPFCIYRGGNFAESLSPCYWSDYYSVNPRTPDNTQLAPWVARFYSKV
ncbi:hypothetical protein DH2020_012930 [Rehmannia glutinosa]|uniref:Calcineurin-like phosphoesterase domain-containing protein n=1 Tax=Rehmannia glutinosa TaxID=99300 RepID=A0ABR0X135_REHGL